MLALRMAGRHELGKEIPARAALGREDKSWVIALSYRKLACELSGISKHDTLQYSPLFIRTSYKLIAVSKVVV